MDQSEREDYLEAIIMHSAEGKGAETITYLSGIMEREPGEVRASLKALKEEGNLAIGEDGSLSLTEKGRSTGETVLKKHRVLECFFTEMLGMDPDTASKEACEIEHAASEYTINKIGRLLSGSGVSYRVRHGTGCGEGSFQNRQCRFDVLDDFAEGDIVRVVGMRHGPGGGRRLIDLGIIPGEEIRILRRLPGRSVLVSIKGSEVAISPEIAGRVVVERVQDTGRL